MQVIVFPHNDGVAVIVPAPEFADQIDAIARKDVPKGVPWRIMATDDLPSYDTRDQWRWTESGPLVIAE